jgi:hypothetical protein
VPFIRYTRDKRGYECTLVMHAYRPTQGPQRTRVLYLFRSPSHLKIGRQALDAEVAEALEHTHPDLSFNWSALVREGVTERPEPRTRPARPDRRQRADVAPKPVLAIDDQTVLGRVAGGAEAARLRRAFTELLQRISRRARTPEDRDRLTERAQRLNPDDWPDEAAARAGLSTLEADWEAIVAELPQRRRGRRGGRRRQLERSAGADGPADPSGIMAEGGEFDVEATDDAGAVAEPDRAADAGGDRGGHSPDAPEPAEAEGAERASAAPSGDVPGDD